jgi:redox-sensitive bicupin YhaK (pirin superfamily)
MKRSESRPRGGTPSSAARKISKVVKSKPTIEGAGVHLKRAFGFYEVPSFDPFLLLDDFHSNDLAHYQAGFPWHPHRGIETITYMFEGRVEHGDSMGNKGVIGPGEVQWMTAGGGIIHQEMPKGARTGAMWGCQLWANLPAADKMMPPRYREVKAKEIPEAALKSGTRIKVICGEVEGVRGPVQDVVTAPEYLDVSMPAGSEFTHAVKPGHTAVAYVLQGEGFFDERRDAFSRQMFGAGWWDSAPRCVCGAESLVLYEKEGDHVAISTEKQPVRFLLLSGRPLGEPVAWYGPIVMNTQEELRVAFEEYQNGTFIRSR